MHTSERELDTNCSRELESLDARGSWTLYTRAASWHENARLCASHGIAHRQSVSCPCSVSHSVRSLYAARGAQLGGLTRPPSNLGSNDPGRGSMEAGGMERHGHVSSSSYDMYPPPHMTALYRVELSGEPARRQTSRNAVLHPFSRIPPGYCSCKSSSDPGCHHLRTRPCP